VFDDATCAFIPPVEYPDDGSLYTWNETDQLWVLAPEQPLDIPTE
jgi:hypothetical protein